MVKVQLDLTEDTKRLVEEVKAKYNLKSKEEAINLIVSRYSFGWIGHPYRGMSQKLLEAILDKIIHYPIWIEYRQREGMEKFWKHVTDIFNLDTTQLNLLKKEFSKSIKGI